jgi:hypothetical protein
MSTATCLFWKRWSEDNIRRRVDKIDTFGSNLGMSRFTIEIELDQHRQIKTLATFAGMTIKEFILSKTIVPSVKSSLTPADTTARLLGSPKNAKRLREAISSKTPEHLVLETTEDLKRALGDRSAMEWFGLDKHGI